MARPSGCYLFCPTICVNLSQQIRPGPSVDSTEIPNANAQGLVTILNDPSEFRLPHFNPKLKVKEKLGPMHLRAGRATVETGQRSVFLKSSISKGCCFQNLYISLETDTLKLSKFWSCKHIKIIF